MNINMKYSNYMPITEISNMNINMTAIVTL